MIAWQPRPFIFVHIPKCAGTSIEQVLIPVITPHRGFDDLPGETRNHHWMPGSQMLQHSKLRRYERHFELGDYFKFALVRDPWDRAVSQIEYLRSRGAVIFNHPSFKENLRIYCQASTYAQGHDLSACQVDYLQTSTGTMGMDYVGRFESLPAAFAEICDKIGITPVPSLPHVFDSRRTKRCRDYYDEESADWIRQRFARDIEQFGYEF